MYDSEIKVLGIIKTNKPTFEWLDRAKKVSTFT